MVPSTLLTELLGAEAMALRIRGLAVVTSVSEAMDRLEVELMSRHRRLDQTDADASGAETPQPEPMTVMCPAPNEQDARRLAAMLRHVGDLRVDAVIAGPWLYGRTITIDQTDQTAARTDHDLDGLPAAQIDAASALTRLRDHAATVATSSSSGAPISTHTTDPPNRSIIALDPVETSGSVRALAVDAAPTSSMYRDQRANVPADRATSAFQATVRIRVLGAPATIVDSPPDSDDNPPFRPQSRELLAYLACHPDGVTEDLLFEDVLGDVPGSKVRSRLNTYVYNLNKRLRAVGGPGSYVTHTPHERVALDTGRLDCDLWRMRRHLQATATATDRHARMDELEHAIDEYTGPLAGDADYYWVLAARETIRREAIDAHSALAELLADTDPAAAAAVVDRAISHDPYNESLYRQGMQLNAAAGSRSAIHRLLERLTSALAELDTTPSADTVRLTDDLISDSDPCSPRP
jgi:DNA-binding SARP family transcriptional activator